MPTICSTLTNDSSYTLWEKHEGNDMPSVKKRVTLKGGAGRGGKGLVTPYGVPTTISDEDLEFLQANPAFQRHSKRGYFTVLKNTKDTDKAANNMSQEDGSRPVTDKNLKAKAGAANAALTLDKAAVEKKKAAE